MQDNFQTMSDRIIGRNILFIYLYHRHRQGSLFVWKDTQGFMISYVTMEPRINVSYCFRVAHILYRKPGGHNLIYYVNRVKFQSWSNLNPKLFVSKLNAPCLNVALNIGVHARRVWINIESGEWGKSLMIMFFWSPISRKQPLPRDGEISFPYMVISAEWDGWDLLCPTNQLAF